MGSENFCWFRVVLVAIIKDLGQSSYFISNSSEGILMLRDLIARGIVKEAIILVKIRKFVANIIGVNHPL